MEEYYDGVVVKPDLDELYHHGVLRQKWGVKHGPPYPLGSDVSTGSRLKTGASGSISKTKKKAAKASVKAAKANKKAAQASNSLLHPIKSKHKDQLQTKAFKAQAKADKLNAKVEKMENKEAKAKEKLTRQSNLVDEELKRLGLSFEEAFDASGNPSKKYEEAFKRAEKEAAKDFDGDIYVPDPNAKNKNSENSNKLVDAQMKGDSKSVSDWVDSHTKVLESRPGKPARIGERDHEGNIIRTNAQLINETAWRGVQEHNKKLAEAANSNQDMFNDILDRAYPNGDPEGKQQGHGVKGQSWGPRNPDQIEALKTYQQELKRVAKESGVSKRALENEILKSYENRMSEISKVDAQRQEQKRAQEKKETINRRLQNAKTRDQWDLGFLEVTQNEKWAGGEGEEYYDKNKMLREYKKYLEDPEEYWRTH